MKSRSEIIDMLRAHDINLTKQRVEIAQVLFNRMEHLSADQILADINRRDASASKATVYNTLKLFLEKKLVREVIVDPTRIFYDPNTHPHHHMYDLGTGALSDLPFEAMSVVGMPTLPAGMVQEGIDVIVRLRQSA